MISSSLASLSTYQLSISKAPKISCKKIEKHWRDFLWKGNHDNLCLKNTNKRSLNHVNWKSTTALKEKGGLSIAPVVDTNFALLNKWLWRYHCELKALWRIFYYAKYSKSFIGDIPSQSRFSSSNAP